MRIIKDLRAIQTVVYCCAAIPNPPWVRRGGRLPRGIYKVRFFAEPVLERSEGLRMTCVI